MFFSTHLTIDVFFFFAYYTITFLIKYLCFTKIGDKTIIFYEHVNTSFRGSIKYVKIENTLIKCKKKSDKIYKIIIIK